MHFPGPKLGHGDTKSLLLLLWVIILTTFLAGCAAPGGLPPAELLQDCPEPLGRVVTNADMAKQNLDLKLSLRACNKDKERLREWVENQ